jgi:hypothetical protein
MIRLSSLRTHCKLFVAVAFLVSAEGVSFARTTAQPMRAQTEAPTARSANVHDVAATVHPTIGDEFARIRICHISRHPRDGVPAEEHACPLVIAYVADGLSSAARALAAD